MSRLYHRVSRLFPTLVPYAGRSPARPLSSMSSTTTAASPTTTTTLRLPLLRPLLTAFPSSERSESAGTSPSAPRFKRRRLDASGAEKWELEETFTQCLNEQVFPYLDQARDQLPSHVDSKRVGTKVTCPSPRTPRSALCPSLPYLSLDQVVALLTGPGSSFNEEYKLGNGRLSQEYERQLAARAFLECARLATLPVRRGAAGATGHVKIMFG